MGSKHIEGSFTLNQSCSKTNSDEVMGLRWERGSSNQNQFDFASEQSSAKMKINISSGRPVEIRIPVRYSDTIQIHVQYADPIHILVQYSDILNVFWTLDWSASDHQNYHVFKCYSKSSTIGDTFTIQTRTRTVFRYPLNIDNAKIVMQA